MEAATLIPQRLAQQRLTQNPFQTAAEVVSWLGAVQAQDYLGTKWALGLRMQAATDDLIEQTFNEGKILRTHVMRPTWHFVTPEDIRWLLDLTGPRVQRVNGTMYRRLELDGALLKRSGQVLARSLEGGHTRTRAELGQALAEAGIMAEGMRLGYIVHHAELEAVVCSGPRRGKQFTYALLEERAPNARRLEREEALAELTRRFYTSHGPATIKDFAWWSGLTIAEVKAGIDMAGGELEKEQINEQAYFFPAARPAAADPGETVFLLPTFDEMLMGYSEFDRSRTGGRVINQEVVFDSMILMNGQISGSWRRTFQKGSVLLETAPFAPLTPNQKTAIAAAARRYGDFVQMPVIMQQTRYLE